MMNQFRNLRRLFKAIKSCSYKAKLELSNYINQNYPDLSEEYAIWFCKERNINAAIGTKVINEAVCGLEGRIFDDHKKTLSFFAGATARMSDDLLDNGIVRAKEVFLLDNDPTRTARISSLRLLYALENRLADLLPPNFSSDFRNIISLFNQAQADSAMLLKSEVTPREIIDLKNRTGGYSVLLLYSFLFPELGDLNLDFKQSYYPNGNVPRTKQEALYNFGAWLSRVDDLLDKPYDKKIGMKQLATEGLITWRKLKQETEYTFHGLSSFYPLDRVKEFREIFEPFTSAFVIFFR